MRKLLRIIFRNDLYPDFHLESGHQRKLLEVKFDIQMD